MNVEEFIKKNPFKGEQVNNSIVKEIQEDINDINFKKNVYRLLKNNARVIYLVWRQYNYNQTLASIMSFVYEGIEKTSKEYNIGSSNKPYYSYLMTYVRGLLQKHYNYNETLIHVPVMKKKEHELDIAEITTISETIYSTEEDGLVSDLDVLFKLYERQNLIGKFKEDFEITKMSRHFPVKEIASKTGMGVGKIRNIIKRTTPRLKAYYDKHIL